MIKQKCFQLYVYKLNYHSNYSHLRKIPNLWLNHKSQLCNFCIIKLVDQSNPSPHTVQSQKLYLASSPPLANIFFYSPKMYFPPSCYRLRKFSNNI